MKRIIEVKGKLVDDKVQFKATARDFACPVWQMVKGNFEICTAYEIQSSEISSK